MHITGLCFSAGIQCTSIYNSVTLDSINRSNEYRLDISGKAINSVRVLNQLEKGCASVVCPLGLENEKEFLKIKEKNHDTFQLYYLSIPGKTRTCTTLIEKCNSRVTELIQEEPPVQMKKEAEHSFTLLEEIVSEQLKESSAFLLAGTIPKGWPQNSAARICKSVSKKNIPLLVDCTGEQLHSILSECTPTIIKINENEFITTFTEVYKNAASHIDNYEKGVHPSPEEILIKAICTASKKLENCIVVTRGENPTLAGYCGAFFNCPVMAIKVVNTIGCGDSFNAGFFYEWLKNYEEGKKPDIQKALKKGTECASKNAEVLQPGTILL